ncbi:hypothetical protein EON65_03235 [archaeon]|nr:MAG: hypothetical protein EON65_03235 [archaeon]
MAAFERDLLYLHSPIALGRNWQYTWFDPAHNHCLLYNDGSIYVLWLNEEHPTPKLLYHKADMTSDIILSRVSLDKELLAIQISLTTCWIVEVSSNRTWTVEVKLPAETIILKGGVMWSDHGGNSQDLVLVTSKGLELFKISAKKNVCKLSRVVAQPSFAFWYNAHHRMILLASYSKPSRFGKAKKDVLLMDGFFLKTDRSAVPTLELPPPDRIPRFELGPGVSSDSIHVLSVYGRLLTLVQYSAGTEDFLTVYQLTKTSVERIYCLPLGGVVNALRVSTHDNLVICHNLPDKSSRVFDLMHPVKSKQTPASIEQVEPITSYGPIFSYVEVLHDELTHEVQQSHEEWNAVEPMLATPSNLQDFDSLRFAEDAHSKHRTSITTPPLVTKTKRHSRPKPVYTVYFSVIFDILSETFALDKESAVMWRVGCNLVEVSNNFKTMKEKVKFMARRGRQYQLTGSDAPLYVSVEEKLAKFSLLRVLLTIITSNAHISAVLEYLEALLSSYAFESRRLQQLTQTSASLVDIDAQASVALQAMDLAQSSASRSASMDTSKPMVRRSSLSDMFSGRNSVAKVKESNGTLDLDIRQSSDPLEPFGLSSALFSDISSIGSRAKAWLRRKLLDDLDNVTSSDKKFEDRKRSRSIKPVHDHALLHLRRDHRGDIIASQTELVSLVFVPYLLKCDGPAYLQWTHILSEYMTRLIEEGIPRTPSLSVLHVNLLYNTGQYSMLAECLNMRLYSDCVELAFMLLQFSDLLDEADVATEELQSLRHVYSDEGVRMLWRLNEKIAVVKWQLNKGMVQEAIEICRSYCTEDSELSARYISGIEFFTSAVKALESNPAGALELLYSVLVFIEFWDSSILSINKVRVTVHHLSLGPFILTFFILCCLYR